ncbi:MAG: fibronectin type III domain-containing protein [Betaproteobacteria bacterium]|nr:fibronectin type III domain-containing protein [Betaproteobacteria bacterium]
MPQLIAFAISAIGFTSGSVLIATAVTVGLKIGINALLGAVFGSGGAKPSDGQVTVRGSVQSRTRNYGIVHTGGALSFEESRDGTLGLVVTLGTGEETEILEHRINDKTVNVDGSGTVTDASFHGAVHIYTRPGSDSQTAISEVTAKFSQWTSNHRQRGCAHAAIICDPVKQELFSEVYGGREPVYSQIRKAVKVYDPRKDSTFPGGSGPQRLANKSTWAWSDTAALVIADYVAHPDGYGLGYDKVNWANIAAQADICEQTVTTVSSATIARWRIWASYKLQSDERRQVLGDMLKACDGFCWQGPDFKFNLLVGAYEAPTLTLTDDHILVMTARRGPTAQQRTSALKMLYTEASTGYREQESALVSVPGVDDDPNTDPQGVPIYYAPHHNQAVRVGKLLAARLGERWHLDLATNLYGLNLLGRRFVRVTSAQAAIDAVFAIETGVKIQPGKDRITVSVGLVEVAAADWSFNAALDEGTPPASGSTSSTFTLATPTGLTLSAVQVSQANGNGVAIQATWDAAGRAGLRYEVRYRPTAGGNWVLMTVESEDRTGWSGPVNSGTQYEVQVRALTIGRFASAWSASVNITPAATSVLSAPSSLTATGGAGSAAVSFRMPPEATLAYARLYRATSSSFGAAVQVGSDIVGGLSQVMSVSDTGLSAGTYYYWVRAFNGSGGASALTGPISATVT